MKIELKTFSGKLIFQDINLSDDLICEFEDEKIIFFNSSVKFEFTSSDEYADFLRIFDGTPANVFVDIERMEKPYCWVRFPVLL